MTSKILYINSPKYDVITALHIEGLLKQPDIHLRFTSLGNYAPENRVLKKQDAIAFGIDEADILILGSRYVDHSTFGRSGNKDNSEISWLLTRQNDDLDSFSHIKKRGLKRIRIEGGDESALGSNLVDFYRCNLIFKRELYLRTWSMLSLRYSLFPGSAGLWCALTAHKLIPFPYYHSMGNPANILLQARNLVRNAVWYYGQNRVKSFPFGIEDRMRGEFNRNPEYELCCMLRPHLAERKQLIDLLRQKDYPKMFLNQISSSKKDIQWMIDRGAAHPEAVKYGGIGFSRNESYLQQLNNSRASISIPGGGFDTLRFWEILGQGSLLISKRIAIEMPFPLKEGVHYVAFDTLDELEKILKWLYANPDDADKIRRSGHEFAMKHHTSDARAKYFLDIMQ